MEALGSGHACVDGEHSVSCGHVAIEHGNHIGFLNDQGSLDCHVRLGDVSPSHKAPVDMCKSFVTTHTLGKSLEAEGARCSINHQEQASNGHNVLRHADHIDYVVGNEVHHFENGQCHIHARRYLKGKESPDIMVINDRNGTGQVIRRRNSVKSTDSQPGKKRMHSSWCRSPDSTRFVTMFFLTGGYFLVELLYGTMIGSLALVADAMHMLSDFIALIVGFYAINVSGHHATLKSTFGWTRIEVVAALMNGTFLLAICFSIFIEAIQRFIVGAESDELAQGADDLLIVAIIGLVMNLVGLFVFGHGHAHNEANDEHEHGQEVETYELEGVNLPLEKADEIQRYDIFAKLTGCIPRVTNLNIRGVLLHVLGDALGSVAVIVSAIFIKYSTSPLRFLADPICSVFIVAVILSGTIPLVQASASILLQQTPRSISSESLIGELMNDPEVFEIHDFHTWVLSSTQVIASMHIILLQGADFMRVSDRLKLILHSFGIHATTIQPEFVKDLDVLHKRGTCHEPECGDRLCVRRSCCPDGNQFVQSEPVAKDE